MLVGVSLQRARASRNGAHLEFECLAAIFCRVSDDQQATSPKPAAAARSSTTTSSSSPPQLKPVPHRTRSRRVEGDANPLIVCGRYFFILFSFILQGFLFCLNFSHYRSKFQCQFLLHMQSDKSELESRMDANTGIHQIQRKMDRPD